MNIAMFAAVAAGGAIGAMVRYGVSLVAGAGFFGIAGPFATMLVNVLGCGLMGIIAGFVANGIVLPDAWRAFGAVGLLGALTTFSSFALDAGNRVQKQGMGMALFYIALSVCLSLASFAACFWLVRVPS